MAIRKFISKEITYRDDTYVGQYGELWISDTGTTLRIGDNTTPGGIEVGSGGIGDLTNTGITWGVWLSEPVHFVKDNYVAAVDEIDTGVQITRANNQGLYNPLEEEEWNGDGPTYTEWNADGWSDLSNVANRSYSTWITISNNYPPGLVNQEIVMHDTLNDKYYTVKFLTWQSGDNGGAFSYIRREINTAARFTKSDNGSEIDVIASGLSITRGDTGGIFNHDQEEEWDEDVSPVGTLWNMDGWDDLSDVTTRQYLTFYTITGTGSLDIRVLGQQFVIHDTINDEYWKVFFTQWTPDSNGGGFSYIREKINVVNPQSGLTFADGSNQTTAFTQQKLGVIPQLLHNQTYDRWLNLGDIGKHIIVTQSNVDIMVPDYADQPFPIGSAITIVNVSGGSVRVRKDNDDENGTIYGAGTVESSTWWSIPDLGGGNICTLIKLAQFAGGEGGNGSVWMLSGPGIEVYED